MEIQRIFSNIEDPEETLYSVLMDEEELAIFSEVQREFTGVVKAANKAAKRAWLEKQGAGGFLGLGKKKGSAAIRNARKKMERDLLGTGRSIEKMGVGLPIKRTISGKRPIETFPLNNRISDVPTRTISVKRPNNVSPLNEKINRKGAVEEPYLREYRDIGDNKWRTRPMSPSKGRKGFLSKTDLKTGKTSFTTPDDEILSINLLRQ